MSTSPDIATIVSALLASPLHLPSTRLVTIDGPAGSGKTTLAAQLSAALNDAPVVHLDDLYDGWYQDLAFDLAPRVTEQILEPLVAGAGARYQRYDWHSGEFANWVDVASHDFLIIEGVGSGHRDLRKYSSLSIWIEVDESTGIDRVINRDGDWSRSHIVSWHERELQFFAEHDVKAAANIQLLGE